MSTAHPPVAAIILAAGASTRLGRPKLLLRHHGVPLLRRAVDAAAAGGCAEIVVVLGADAEHYRPLLAGLAVRTVVNAAYREGMSSSIRAGVEAVSEAARGAVILLADQPFIDAGIVRRLIDTYHRSGMKIVTCEYGGVRGVPTLFDRALFLELLILEGDQGARQVMAAYPRHVTAVEIPAAAARDVDSPEDARLLQGD